MDSNELMASSAAAASGLAQTVAALTADRRSFKWSKKMFDYQQDYLNTYNSPTNQMQRLKDAGLNPNLMYGNGSASTGNASGSMPVYHSDTTSALSEAVNLLALQQQQANIQKTNAETSLLESRNTGQQWLNDFNSATTNVQKNMLVGKLGDVIAGMDLKNASLAIDYGFEPSYKNFYLNDENDERVYLGPNLHADLYASSLKYHQTRVYDSNVDVNSARVKLMGVQERLVEGNISLIDAKRELLEIQNEYEEAFKRLGLAKPFLQTGLQILKIICR